MRWNLTSLKTNYFSKHAHIPKSLIRTGHTHQRKSIKGRSAGVLLHWSRSSQLSGTTKQIFKDRSLIYRRRAYIDYSYPCTLLKCGPIRCWCSHWCTCASRWSWSTRLQHPAELPECPHPHRVPTTLTNQTAAADLHNCSTWRRCTTESRVQRWRWELRGRSKMRTHLEHSLQLALKSLATLLEQVRIQIHAVLYLIVRDTIIIYIWYN